MNSISTLIDDYAAGAELLRDALYGAEKSDLDARPIEGRWSIREVVCHLAETLLQRITNHIPHHTAFINEKLAALKR
jgi:hypothetical protein